MKNDLERFIGRVTEALPNTQFMVETFTRPGGAVRCRLAGKLKLHRIRVMVGDKVEFVMEDPERGRIIFRHRT